jgi:hypothetical protein
MLGVISSVLIVGFLTGGFLLEDGFWDFLSAIFVLQKFTGKEVRD